jgi:CheY-like chemotaxis protein
VTRHELQGVKTEVSGLRILVVDNTVGAEMLAQELSSRECDVRLARSGVAALDVIWDFVPDLALVDLGLPAMDALELVQRLRQHPRLGATWLLAASAFQVPPRLLIGQTGFDGYLSKPVVCSTLARVVGSLRAPLKPPLAVRSASSGTHARFARIAS